MDDTTTSGPRAATARGRARAAAHRRVVPSRTSRAQISSGGTQRTSTDSWADPKPVAPREPLPLCVRPVQASTQLPITNPRSSSVPRASRLRRNLDGTSPRLARPAVITGTRASNGERGRLTSCFGPVRDSQRVNQENRATHGPQVQAGRSHRRLVEAANIVAGHGNTGG